MSAFFFFNDPATTGIYPLPLHDALPIFEEVCRLVRLQADVTEPDPAVREVYDAYYRAFSSLFPASQGVMHDLSRLAQGRSEEHTSELQSQSNLVCRLLLDKKTDTHTQHR